MFKKIDSPIGHWSLLLLLSLIWGSLFILMKRRLEAFSFGQVAALRLFIAFVFLAVLGREFYKSIPKEKLWFLFLTGLIGNGIPALLFTKSQTFLDSGIVGILNVLTPLFTLFIGLFFFNLKVKLINYVGIGIGMVGAIYLLYPDIQDINDKVLLYSLMAISATVCYGLSTNIIKTHLQELNQLPFL